MGLSDVFLNEDRFPGHQQTLNEVADLEGGVAKKHAVALGALGDLDDDRQATDGVDGLFHIQNVPDVDRFRDGEPVPGKNLRCVEFVATLDDALAGVGGPDAQLFDVSKHGDTVLRDGMADARDHGVFRKGLAAMQHVDAALIDHQRELHRVAHFHVEAAFSCLLNDATRAVEPRPSTENGQAHGHESSRFGHLFDSIGSHRA